MQTKLSALLLAGLMSTYAMGETVENYKGVGELSNQECSISVTKDDLGKIIKVQGILAGSQWSALSESPRPASAEESELTINFPINDKAIISKFIFDEGYSATIRTRNGVVKEKNTLSVYTKGGVLTKIENKYALKMALLLKMEEGSGSCSNLELADK